MNCTMTDRFFYHWIKLCTSDIYSHKDPKIDVSTSSRTCCLLFGCDRNNHWEAQTCVIFGLISLWRLFPLTTQVTVLLLSIITHSYWHRNGYFNQKTQVNEIMLIACWLSVVQAFKWLSEDRWLITVHMSPEASYWPLNCSWRWTFRADAQWLLVMLKR